MAEFDRLRALAFSFISLSGVVEPTFKRICNGGGSLKENISLEFTLVREYLVAKEMDRPAAKAPGRAWLLAVVAGSRIGSPASEVGSSLAPREAPFGSCLLWGNRRAPFRIGPNDQGVFSSTSTIANERELWRRLAATSDAGSLNTGFAEQAPARDYEYGILFSSARGF